MTSQKNGDYDNNEVIFTTLFVDLYILFHCLLTGKNQIVLDFYLLTHPLIGHHLRHVPRTIVRASAHGALLSLGHSHGATLSTRGSTLGSRARGPRVSALGTPVV